MPDPPFPNGAASDTGAVDTAISSADGTRLAAHHARPSGTARTRGVVVCHGFPTGPRGAVASASTYPELVDRVARETGCPSLTFNFRGTGTSDGDFSAPGWAEDIAAAVDAVTEDGAVQSVVLVGVAEGGTFALCAAVDDPRVTAVATLAAPRSLHELARDPARVLEHARRVGTVRTPDFPPSVSDWGRALAAVDAEAAAARLGERPLMVFHGSDDSVVPPADARALADAAPTGELRLVAAAGHELRHDPRVIAGLLGWIDRLD